MRSFIGQRGHGVTSSGREARRLADQLDLRHRRGALAVRVRDAVGAGVAAADHDHVLAGGGDHRRLRRAAGAPGICGPSLARDVAVALVEVLHREVDAAELAARHRQVARDARAGRDHDRVELRPQLVGGDVDADVDAEAELDALGGELLDAPLDDPLLDLEVRDAEAHEPAAGLVALEHASPRGPARRSCCAHARPAGPAPITATDRPVSRVGRLRRDPALVPGAVDDRELDLLDRDRLALADLEHARRLARRGAEPAR